MIKKLNGWQRLWVVVSGLYLCLVVVYVTLTLPTPANIPHSQTFYDQLRPELKNKMDEWMVISETPAPKKNAQQKLQEEWDKSETLPLSNYSDEELRKIAGIQSVEMPNGHVLHFPSKLPAKDKTEVTQDYWRIVEKAASQKRLHYLFMALLFWSGPVIILYVLGWSVGWVRRGFKKQL
jgi:hypothetical protein